MSISILKSKAKDAAIGINLNDSGQASENFYTTGDQIEGDISISFDESTIVHDLSISFNGQSTTVLTNLQPWSNASASTRRTHTFLCMNQPISPQVVSELNASEKGKVHTIPFIFTIPDHLTVHACSHDTASDEVRKAHLLLPPSLGRSSTEHPVANDLAPETATITYAIRVCVKQSSSNKEATRIIEKELPVLVMPKTTEEPPSFLTESDPHYRLRSERDVFKGVMNLGRSTGHLTATTSQPNSLKVLSRTNESGESIAIPVTIDLKFDPTCENELPPRLFTLRTKLHAYTFFTSTSYGKMPAPSDCDDHNGGCTLNSQVVKLSRHGLGGVRWQLHEHIPNLKSTDLSEPRATDMAAASHSKFYTASIQIPITLPPRNTGSQNIRIVPSFISCIIARSYMLEMKLAYRYSPQLQPPSGFNKDLDDEESSSDNSNSVLIAPDSRSQLFGYSSNITLKVPLQVTNS